MSRPRSSRQLYRSFVDDYKHRRLDDSQKQSEDAGPGKSRGKRRQYLREYLRWLWPHRYAAGALFVLALTGAGLQMVEPLFMRYIVDQVLLKTGLDPAARLSRLNLAGTLFFALVFVSNFVAL
jgi:ATP-binding cassette subfamily B protein/subfamily B ATP-binding cassette protein MsbA